MPDHTDQLHPADPSEVIETLSHALRYDGRNRVFQADTLVARMVADRLMEHLERSGFVVMRRPERAAPSTSGMPAPGR